MIEGHDRDARPPAPQKAGVAGRVARSGYPGGQAGTSDTQGAVPSAVRARAEGIGPRPATTYAPPGASGRQAAAPLGNHATNAYAPTPQGSIEEPRRATRASLRAHLWEQVPPGEHRVQRCGRVRLFGAPLVALAGDGTAHFRGLETCGSVTGCPVCSAKVRQRRAEEIDDALGRHLAGDGGVVFVTLTLRHSQGMALGALWGAVSASWRSLVSGRHRAGLRDRFGVVGFIRSVEVTHGKAGWHPHAHVALVTDRVLDLDELRELHRFLHTRWSRRVVAMGFGPPSLDRGVRVLPVYSADGMGQYLTKIADEEGGECTPGLELARADLKAGRGANRSPFAILRDHAEQGDAADWRLFSEWLTVSKGRRTLEWSRGLRALLLPDDEELTDEQIAEEAEPPAVNVAAIASAVWVELVRLRLTVPVLAAVEARGLGGLIVLVRAAGLDVGLERQDLGPPQLVMFDPPCCWG